MIIQKWKIIHPHEELQNGFQHTHMIRRNQRVPTPTTTIQWPRANEFLTYCLTLALWLIFIYLISRKTDISFVKKEFSVCKSNWEGLVEFHKNMRYFIWHFYIYMSAETIYLSDSRRRQTSGAIIYFIEGRSPSRH